MSFLVGPIAGALVTGGVYYGFSHLIQSRTAQHRSDLHVLSERLIASSAMPADIPAAARITHRPFVSLVQSKWNDQIASVFNGARQWEQRAQNWGREVFYGSDSK